MRQMTTDFDDILWLCHVSKIKTIRNRNEICRRFRKYRASLSIKWAVSKWKRARGILGGAQSIARVNKLIKCLSGKYDKASKGRRNKKEAMPADMRARYASASMVK